MSARGSDTPLGSGKSGRSSRNGDAVVRLLRGHGIDRPTAEKLFAAGAGLRELTQRDGVEFGLTVDLTSGNPVGEVLRGSGRDVDFEAHRRELQPGHHYATLHTHP